ERVGRRGVGVKRRCRHGVAEEDDEINRATFADAAFRLEMGRPGCSARRPARPWISTTHARLQARAQAAKLPNFRLHDLRHTFASLLLTKGAPITYVAAQLGHSKPTTTLHWYAHWLPTSKAHVRRRAR